MTTTAAPRYRVVTRQVAAPGRGRNYYYPAEVRVYDTHQSEWHATRGLNDGLKFARRVCGTRYAGPRSEYGRALAEARAVAAALNYGQPDLDYRPADLIPEDHHAA